jgi:hypothetical protein
MTPRDAVLGLKTVASLLNRFQTLPVFGGSPTVHKLCGFGVLFQPKPASDSRNAWQCFQHVTGWFRMAWSAKSGYEPEGREFESLRAETLGIEARFRPKGCMLRVDEARDRRCGGFQTQDFSEGAAAGAGAPCEAAVCQRELESGDRNINPDDHIRVRGKNYHTGCEPPDENE